MSSNRDEPDAEVLPPKGKAAPKDDSRPAIYADIVAQLNHYTDRPDLFLETIEKYDPGFIARMNSEAEKFSKETRDTRFKFGRNQAYVALSVSVVSAVAVMCGFLLLIYTKQASFWSLVGLAIVYAVTQGGSKGFTSPIEGMESLVENWRGSHPKD